MGRSPVKWAAKAITALTLHTRKSPVQRFDYAFFAVLLSLVLAWCYQSAGVPLAQALAKLQAADEAEAQGETVVTFADADNSTINSILDLAQEEENSDGDLWASFEKAQNEGIDLPYGWQPDFWPLFCLAAVGVLMCLWYFGQLWSVNFKCLVTTNKASTLKEAELVCCVPRPHRGKAAIVPLQGRGTLRPFFVFQKQRYEWDPEQNVFTKVVAPVDKNISYYVKAKPVQSRKEVEEKLLHYGENKFDIPLPTFGDMYREQITSPFFVFQMFCILLWCLEEYWQYSLFNLAMVLGFEATVTLTRRLNIKKLRGMGNKASSCLVYRVDGWSVIPADKLLPGDRIRLQAGTGDEAIVPCDCLLLAGSAVVNESTLTGESIPLMKEALQIPEQDRPLDIKRADKVHVLYGGTQLMEAKDANGREGYCDCYVLRTGFSSSQGKLVRKIEFSTEKVSPSSRDAALLLLFLLVFALISSGYVLHRGLTEGKRTRFDLLVHCILIVTSVVPPDLPMQMALAIQNSLTTLMKMQVFCTEPHRIPSAGKVIACCFDKTGTITTDKLHAAGIVPASAATNSSGGAIADMQSMLSADYASCLVIAGCHSLVTIAKQQVGDPLETAAINSIGWLYVSDDNVARPLQGLHAANKTAKSVPSNTAVRILHRHHFASKLQRMSVLASVSGEAEEGEQLYVLAKGSPEVIKGLLSKEQQAMLTSYDEQQRSLAKSGYRVIALAYKRIPDKDRRIVMTNRTECERQLIFAGFVAFNCLNRADSTAVLSELRDSSHRVIMLTGDSLLTAAHVGMTTEMLPGKADQVLLLHQATHSDALEWHRYDTDEVVTRFSVQGLEDLAKTYGLCISGDLFEKAVQRDKTLWKYVHLISVYARMKPEQKEAVLLAMRNNGLATLMCGDGTNDVGALKAADVGVALLSGFGEVNAEKEKTAEENNTEKAIQESLGEGAKQLTPTELAWINDPLVPQAMRQKRLENFLLQRKIGKRAEELKKKGVWAYNLQARMEIIKEQGEKALKEKHEEQQRMRSAASNGAPVQSASKTKNPNNPWEALEDQGLGEVDMVKLGDASIAAPFTSKMPSIRSTIDIIRQGRATLLSTLQMYQILALNCLISSYSLSVLYLDGMKYGDRQMTAQGILGTICFLCISRGNPLPKLSPVHPPTSIFHPGLFVSMIGQFCIHLWTLVHNTALAREHLPADYDPDVKGKFKPNVFNTVVFLTACVQQVSVFFVNYKGRPFMENIFDNSVLMVFLLVFAFGTALLASESLPFINRFMELEPLASAEFKSSVLMSLIFDFVGCYVIDRVATLIFMANIWKHSMPTANDFRRFVKLAFWTGAIMYLLLPKTEEDLELMLEMQGNSTTTADHA